MLEESKQNKLGTCGKHLFQFKLFLVNTEDTSGYCRIKREFSKKILKRESNIFEFNYKESRTYIEEYKVLQFISSVLAQIYHSRIPATALVFTLQT